MGFDASVISGVVKFIEPEFGLTKLQLGWAVSSLTLTATIAMMIAGPLSDKFGRRKILFFAASLYALSALCSAIATDFVFLVIARMLGGFGVGASLIIAPMYIAEIAPANIRGRLVSFNQLNIVIGISAAFFTNYLIIKLGQSDAEWIRAIGLEKNNWRWMLGIEAIPAIIYFMALFIVPRSPRWLIMKGFDNEAIAIMTKSASKEIVLTEIETVKQSLSADSANEKIRFREIFAPVLKPVLTIGIVLAILQQITGINSVFFYAPMIFEMSGLGVDASFSQAVLVGLINLVFTILAIIFIDKIGRKPLLIVGVTGIAISMFALSYGFNSAKYTLSKETISVLPAEISTDKLKTITDFVFNNETEFVSALNNAPGEKISAEHQSLIIAKAIQINSTLILIAILSFVASFAISIGPIMWVLFSELFPNRIRALAISFVGFVNSVVSFLVQLIFPWELTNWGTTTTFMIYGIFAAAGLIFIVLKVPETKGKTLEELQLILLKIKKS